MKITLKNMTYYYNGGFGNLSLAGQDFAHAGEYEVLDETTQHFFWSLLLMLGIFTKVEAEPIAEVTPEVEAEVTPEVEAEVTPEVEAEVTTSKSSKKS